MSELKNIKDKDVKKFSLYNRIFETKIVNCYDADTCKAVFNFKDELCKFNCRLSGLDTPEMRPSRKNKNREIEKKTAKYARNYLVNEITDIDIDLLKNYTKKEIQNLINKHKKLVYIKCKDFDKYGRLLIKIYNKDPSDGTKDSINRQLVNEGLANKYNGGRKTSFNFEEIIKNFEIKNKKN